MKKILLLILLLPSLAFAQNYEAAVKALNPTAWWKGYYGNTIYGAGYRTIATIRDFSGNSRTFTQPAIGFEAVTTGQSNRENWVNYSNTFGSWANNNITITADALANPISGHIDADHLAATANNASRYQALPAYPEVFKAGTWEYSVYTKTDTAAYAQIKISDGTSNKYTNLKFSDGTCTTTAGTTCSVETLSGGWYRIKQIWVMAAPPVTSGNVQVCPNAGTGDNCATSNGVAAYFYGAQLRNTSLSDDAFLSNDNPSLFLRGVSGIPALHFGGLNDYYTSTATLSNIVTADASTYFVVFRTNDDVTTTQKIFTDVGGYNQIDITSSSARFTNIDAGGSDTINYPVVANTAYILVAKHSGGNLELNLNGGTPAVPVASGTTTDLTGTLILGRTNAGTSYTNTDLTEFLVFNSALSIADTQIVYDYLSWTLSNPWKRVEVTP